MNFMLYLIKLLPSFLIFFILMFKIFTLIYGFFYVFEVKLDWFTRLKKILFI